MLRWFNGLNYQKKLLISYFLLIMLPIFLIVFFLLTDMTRSTVRENRERANSAFTQSLLSMDNYFDGYINLSQTLMTDTYLTGFLNKKYPAGTTYEKKHFDYTEVSHTYSSRFVYEGLSGDVFAIKTGNRGILCYTDLLTYISDSDRTTDWYKSAVGAPNSCVFSAPVSNQGRKMVPMSMCLTPRSGITNIFKVEIVASNIRNVLLSEAGGKEFYFVNGDMTILASDDYSLIGASLFDTDYAFLGEQLADLDGRMAMERGASIVSMGQVCQGSVLTDCYLIEVYHTTPLLQSLWHTLSRSIPLWIVVLVLDTIMIVLFSRGLSKRVSELVRSVRKITSGSMDAVIELEGQDEIAELSRHMKAMMEHINNLIRDVYQSELQLKTAEILALQSQINPHFLFNCLQAINTSALKSGALETSDMIVSYSRVVRKSIEWKTGIVALNQELDLVNEYLKIQSNRFADRFRYSIEVDPAVEQALIPKFSIQPIVENAMLHGVEAATGERWVRVSAQREDDSLILIVQDTGVGMPKERLESIRQAIAADSFTELDKHIGILNVHRRIRLLYGDDFGVELRSKLGEGTCVTIRLPFNPA